MLSRVPLRPRSFVQGVIIPFAWAIAWMVAGSWSGWTLACTLIGVAGALAIVESAQRLRCPRCGANPRPSRQTMNVPKSCPKCALDLTLSPPGGGLYR